MKALLLQALMTLKVCHITSKHNVSDTRIFYKECMALASTYQVVLLAGISTPDTGKAIYEGISILPYPYRLNKNLRNLFHVFKAAIKQQANVYHLHDPDLLPLAWILNLLGKKLIYDVHENYHETLKEHRASGMTKKLFNLFDRWAAKHCAVILAERSYIPLYQGIAKNLCVVENFCDMELLKPYRVINRSHCRKIVYIGTIHAHRGALRMLEAFHILRERGLDIHLDLIGKITDLGLLPEIEKLAFYPKIKDEISWHGQLTITESYAITMESFAGLCLIDAIPNHLESYPTKLFEYMAVGLPVVASNISLYRAVIERRECGICVPPENIIAITDAIEKIYNDKGLAEQFSIHGPPAVSQNYNWMAEKNILLDFYCKLIGS